MALGNFGPFELMIVLIVWLIPLAIAVWLAVMLMRFVRAIERIATSTEVLARGNESPSR